MIDLDALERRGNCDRKNGKLHDKQQQIIEFVELPDP
jgi:hypothetical protein